MIKFKPTSLKEKNEKEKLPLTVNAIKEELENALCEIDEANAERIALIENALCELDIGGIV